jgi:penicillin-binding protein 1A
LFLVGALFCGICFYVFHHHAIDFSRLERNISQPSLLLDDQGREWARFALDKREPITFAEMPSQVIQAFIAAEDWHFFEHHGISWRGVMRSILVNIMSGRRAQGASTITQQLVRLLFLDAQKTFIRKIKEQMCAILVEQQFTKEHILQTYLNHIYFGCGIYGVEAASQRFWGKSVRELDIHESATLAAIICAPNRYCPLLYPASAERRRNIILGSMHKLGFITKEEYETACAVPLSITAKQEDIIAPHLKESLRIQLEKMVGKKALYTEGLRIYTTINIDMQIAAQHAFTKQIETLRIERNKPFDGGMLSIDIASGAIKAYVGGYSFVDSKYDRVCLARRQIGSTFKVLIYAAALQAGKKCNDTAIDDPFSLTQADGTIWSPRNYSRDYRGQMTLAYALSRSNNIVALKTLLDVGIQPVIDLAKRCHIAHDIAPYPSLALGCIDAPLLSVVGMFNIFANNGLYVKPYSILSIKDTVGNTIWRKPKQQPERIFDAYISGQIARVLMLGIDRLRKRYPQWISVEALYKTGTTDDWCTCWFMGSTPNLTTGVYIGCDDNRPMGNNVFPIHTAFPIWLAFNKEVPQVRTNFIFDPTLKEVIVDEKTGRIVRNSNEPGTIRILV